MKSKSLNLFVGIIVAVLFSGTIIGAYEKNVSFIQIIVGFIIYLPVIIFIGSLTSKVASFIITSLTVLLIYFLLKAGYTDFWIGILLAAYIGIPTLIFRVEKFQTFNQEEYKRNVENQWKERKK